MEQRKEIVRNFVGQGLSVIMAVLIAGIKKSTYYYRSNGKPKGKPPSTHTCKVDGQVVENDFVVKEITDIISPEYHDYGYHVATHQLRRKGYIINPKKVYRLMKASSLLHPKTTKPVNKNRLRINQTIPPLEGPFITVEADIKYVFVHGQNKNAYLITFLCTFSRCAPVWDLDYSMKAGRIIDLVKEFVNHPVVKGNTDYQRLKIKIRTDNGPQFIAKRLAAALEEMEITHEFIHPGTPQENGHIESFHSTVTRLVCIRNIFQDLIHARNIFSDFYYAYNNTRVMQPLLYYSPYEFLSLWKSGIVGIKKDKNNKDVFFFREKPSAMEAVGNSLEDLLVLSRFNNFIPSISNHLEISPVL